MPNAKSSRLSRRDFLKTAASTAGAVTAAVASVSAAPTIVPGRVFQRPAPSETLSFGCIGVGRQGQGDMQELIYRGLQLGARVTALCDVDAHRAEDAQWLAERIYGKELGIDRKPAIAVFHDFRELLARADIDGVLIVTPDFWHAPMAIAAANAGKDIYLEKPMTYSIAEGRGLVEAVRRNKRVLQVGSQQRSQGYFRIACEAARNGRVGKIHTIRVWNPIDSGTGDPAPQPVPKYLDYAFWMGPTADQPFTEDRVHPQVGYGRPGWLQIERYCRGMITGWGSHMNDIAQWGNGSDDTGPVEISAKGEFPDRGLFDVHTHYTSEGLYANGVRLLQETGDPAGVRFEGDKGWIFCSREKVEASDPALLRRKPGPGEVQLPVSTNHMRNFLECVRSRKDPIAPVEAGHRSNTICCITHIAMKLGRKLRWDPKAEKFVGDDDANKMLDYPHRAPWTI
jgi:myo-inositol 2-dehydrogenase / D-chiro-inositol 1-dehydrogenase